MDMKDGIGKSKRKAGLQRINGGAKVRSTGSSFIIREGQVGIHWHGAVDLVATLGLKPHSFEIA